jgi:hypothetical protein
MQKDQFSFNKSIGLLMILVAAFSMVIISSCKDKISKVPTCVKLTKAQIQKWVDKGYTDTTKPNYMSSLRFKTAYAFPGTPFGVFVIGVRKDGKVIEESLTKLTPVDTCKKDHVELSDYIFTGMIPVDLVDLKILQGDGKKVTDSLENVVLQPYDWSDPNTHFNFLAYHFSIFKKGGVVIKPEVTTTMALKIGLPCPPCPNCPNPCPPPAGCVSPCTAAVDSVK